MYPLLDVKKLSDGTVHISGRGIVNGTNVSLTVPNSEWDRYINGAPIHIALSSLTVDEREFIISGIEPGQFDNFLGEEDE